MMSGTKLSFNQETYHTLLKLYVKREDIEGVKDVLKQMHEANIFFNEEIYTMLLKLYVKRGDIQGSNDILDKMQENNFHPNEEILADTSPP